MQVTRVSFMNFNGGKKIASKDLKKAENAIKEEVNKTRAFIPDTALTGNIDNAVEDTYVKQYAENREVMREIRREPERDIAENYFAPFIPIEHK